MTTTQCCCARRRTRTQWRWAHNTLGLLKAQVVFMITTSSTRGALLPPLWPTVQMAQRAQPLPVMLAKANAQVVPQVVVQTAVLTAGQVEVEMQLG
jgi:hypothetical protein